MNYEDSDKPLIKEGVSGKIIHRVKLKDIEWQFASNVWFPYKHLWQRKEKLCPGLKKWYLSVLETDVPSTALRVLINGSFATRRYCPELVDVLCLYEGSGKISHEKVCVIIKRCAESYTKKYYCSVRVGPMTKNMNILKLAQKCFGHGNGKDANIFEVVT